MKARSFIIPPPGVSLALTAALLFGASMPAAKALLGQVTPLLLAGLLYLGSGVGLAICWWLRIRLTGRDFQEARVMRPVLLMVGLSATPASSASLLLNFEGVFTALLAWGVFKEHYGHRIALG